MIEIKYFLLALWEGIKYMKKYLIYIYSRETFKSKDESFFITDKIFEEMSIHKMWCFFVGMYRYPLYVFNPQKMRWFIRKQIDARVATMNNECYESGSCTKCGCMTIQLQMCSDACKGNCYPTMMSEREWKVVESGGLFEDMRGFWSLYNGKFLFQPKTNNKR